MKYKYESELLQILHEEWMDMHRSGIIGDEEMREFEKDCIIQVDKTGPEAENHPKKEPATA